MLAKLRQNSFNAKRQLYEYDILNDKKQVVGMAQLRLKPSKSPVMPAGFESHVYYEVNVGYRGKGYAKTALKELLLIAKRKDLKQLVATVNADNIASIKVIEDCGGKLTARARTTDDKEVLRYEILTN